MDIQALRLSLYPLGFAASFAFSARFLIQWIKSERKQESLLQPSFWYWSCVGNALMACHGFIQVQVHICIIQTINLICSWRNLQLMRHGPSQPPLRRTLYLFPLSVILVLILFALQNRLAEDLSTSWLRIAELPWNPGLQTTASLYWHILGCTGMSIFALRFWLQWWHAEKHRKSELSTSFWWLSLGGGLLSLLYFLPLGDLVHIVSYGTGLIPYIRNLILKNKTRIRSSQAS